MQAHIKLLLLTAAILSVASAGEVRTWGFNSVGELGQGSETISEIISEPTPINMTSAIKGQDISHICCGENYCMALSASGDLFSWGDNIVGQLGDGNSKNQAVAVRVATKEKIHSISCGQDHVLALTESSSILAWGWNYRGQIADSMDNYMSATPRKISFFASKQIRIKQIAAGYLHSMALSEDNNVYTWGDNEYGQLGVGQGSDQPYSNVPAMVQGLPKIREIGAGGSHSFAVGVNNHVYAWGDNSMGQLGSGSESDSPAFKPVVCNASAIASQIAMITGGSAHSLAFTYKGELYAWGANTFGQLGFGDKIDRFVPEKLDLKVRRISGGYLHTLAISMDYELWAWGANSSGQLGDGDRDDVESPKKIHASGSEVAAGKFFSACI